MPQIDNTLTLLILAAVSPFIGSFLGTLAIRLPARRPVLTGRSQCDHCLHVLGPRDLVPLLSWFLARGKCRYCGTRLSFYYPAIEIAAFAVVLLAATVTNGWLLVASCITGWTTLTLAAGWLVRRYGVLNSG
jgi:leader peptidase (prepilin peptidase)/N-methyltransferase